MKTLPLINQVKSLDMWTQEIFNNKLRDFEQHCKGKKTDEIATHMLMLMIRGIFIKMQFPHAQFPTRGM